MDAKLDRDRGQGEIIEARLLAGSDYPKAYRKGSPVTLLLDERSGEVIVARGSGAVKLGLLIGRLPASLAKCLQMGLPCRGRIIDVGVGVHGKLLRVIIGVPEPAPQHSGQRLRPR